MSLVTHLLKADARRFMWPMASWVALTVAAVVFEAAVPRLGDAERMWPFLALSMGALWAARMILAAALTVLIVQTHVPVGTEAFWLTRPIPRASLVCSKLLLVLGLVVCVPAVCDAVIMLMYDVPPADVAKVVVEWSIVRAIVALIVMVFAASTRNLAHFALACGAVIAAAAIVSIALVAVMSWRNRDAVGVLGVVSGDVAYEFASRWPDDTPTVASWGVLIAASLLALWSQFRHRRVRRSIAIGVAGGLAAALVGVSWPWALLHAEPQTPGWAADDQLRLEAPSQAIWFDNGGLQFGDAPRWHTAYAEMHLRGLPDGWIARVQLLRGTLRYEGRTVLSGPAPGSLVVRHSPGAPNTVKTTLMKVLDVGVIRDQWHERSSKVPVMLVKHADLPVARTRASYDGEFQIDLRHFELAGTLPLAAGAVFREGAYRLRIERVESREGGPRLSATVSTAFSVFDRVARPWYAVYLRNTRTREAVEGHMRPTTSHLRGSGPLIMGPYAPVGRATGFFADAYDIRFASTYTSRLPSALPPGDGFDRKDEAWLASAEVVIVRTTAGATVRRTVTIPLVALNGGAIATKDR